MIKYFSSNKVNMELVLKNAREQVVSDAKAEARNYGTQEQEEDEEEREEDEEEKEEEKIRREVPLLYNVSATRLR